MNECRKMKQVTTNHNYNWNKMLFANMHECVHTLVLFLSRRKIGVCLLMVLHFLCKVKPRKSLRSVLRSLISCHSARVRDPVRACVRERESVCVRVGGRGCVCYTKIANLNTSMFIESNLNGLT